MSEPKPPDPKRPRRWPWWVRTVVVVTLSVATCAVLDWVWLLHQWGFHYRW